MNGTTLAALAIALLALPSGLATLTPPPASSCEVSDFAIVPADESLTPEGDFTLDAACGIIVHGSIVGGASIALRSDGPILILGSLVAGAGSMPGADGGGITVEAGRSAAACATTPLCSAASLFVAPDAVVRAGDGAPGALGAVDEACGCVQGGKGGDGGNVHLLATHGEAVVLGIIEAGAGADGGDALAIAPSPSLSAAMAAAPATSSSP